jgi:cephalosporin-C deacetylase-like acetyl esterase
MKKDSPNSLNMNPYKYKIDTKDYKITLNRTTPLWSDYDIEFSPAGAGSYFEGDVLRGEYCFPRTKKPAPLVILSHGMGKHSLVWCRLLAHTLAKKGISSLTLYLVVHQQRMPEKIKEHYPNLTADEWFECYRTSVTDIRRAVDWGYNREDIDHDKISVLGISFGGFVSSIAMGIDERIKAGVFMISAGNSEKITMNSWLLKHAYKYDQSQYASNQEIYARYLREVYAKGFENVPAAKNSFLTDPMTFAPNLRSRPLLMVNALFDEMIPRVAARDMWDACGRPPIAWFPATHASIWVWYPLIGQKVSRFLTTAL